MRHLFSKKLKTNCRGRKFTTDNKLMIAGGGYFAELPKDFSLEGMRQLEKRWIKARFIHLQVTLSGQ
jgi:hypothetical protein